MSETNKSRIDHIDVLDIMYSMLKNDEFEAESTYQIIKRLMNTVDNLGEKSA